MSCFKPRSHRTRFVARCERGFTVCNQSVQGRPSFLSSITSRKPRDRCPVEVYGVAWWILYWSIVQAVHQAAVYSKSYVQTNCICWLIKLTATMCLQRLHAFNAVLYSVSSRTIWWPLWTQLFMWKEDGVVRSTHRTMSLSTGLFRRTVQTQWVSFSVGVVLWCLNNDSWSPAT